MASECCEALTAAPSNKFQSSFHQPGRPVWRIYTKSTWTFLYSFKISESLTMDEPRFEGEALTAAPSKQIPILVSLAQKTSQFSEWGCNQNCLNGECLNIKIDQGIGGIQIAHQCTKEAQSPSDSKFFEFLLICHDCPLRLSQKAETTVRILSNLDEPIMWNKTHGSVTRGSI